MAGTATLFGPWPAYPELVSADFGYLVEAADWWERIAEQAESAFAEVAREVRRPGGIEWDGAGGDRAAQRAHADLVTVRDRAWDWRGAASIARQGRQAMDAARQLVLDAVDRAEGDGFRIGDDYSVYDTRQAFSDAELAERQRVAEAHGAYICHRVAALVADDRAIADRLEATVDLDDLTFDEPGPDDKNGRVHAVDNRTSQDANRRQNQIDAFKRMFGREPASTADWDTAEVLDPYSYEPTYRGAGPGIQVARIKPVPGQGVVRTSQWIEQRDVYNVPFTRNFGNDRRADPHFDPENTKVTTYIDYENGIVVMRQNPSVELNGDGGPGEVRVGVPQGSVTQAADGSVRIKYSAGNPLAPSAATSPPGPLLSHRVTVNGDLVFTPGPDGVRVDGTRTDYPSMEVYQDLPSGVTRTVLVDPADSGRSLGPLFNLSFHHDVGAGGHAFEPFDRVPLPATDFGPAVRVTR